MKKALSRNPNMLRTMIGMGLVLIIVLSYAVYSNTVDSEYYRYETTNEEINYELMQSDENESAWFVSTSSATTWLNISVLNAPSDTVLTVTSTSSLWHSSELLGEGGDAVFNCKEFDEVSESCISAYTHSLELDEGSGILRGRVSLTLPIEGVGYLQAADPESAELAAEALVDDERVLTTWIIEITDEGEMISAAGIEVTLTMAEHELVSVSEFELDPVQETLYGIATLIGCFGLLIAFPMIAYFASVAKSRIDEENRSDDPAPVN